MPTASSQGETRVDTSVPSIARVYDALCGGKDHFAVDRQVMHRLVQVTPEAKRVVRANRDWLIRVCRYLAGTAGITQFLDAGSGLPTAENTHEAVQRVSPTAEVVYLDNDPAVLAYGRALLENNRHTRLAKADLTRPDEVLAAPEVTAALDLSAPVALLQCGTLHHVEPYDTAQAVLQDYIAALAPGSYVALTHMHNPRDGSQAAEIASGFESTFQNTLGTARYRTRNEIAALMDGLELVEPGLVSLHEWWPDGPPPAEQHPVMYTLLGALGRKPADEHAAKRS